ncbi:hypothetical protein HMPREF9374_1774 [Desmospora sp. 8437]|nr:hypothetical protein HMPREF9374_1774 [Desmospora sp. 8437]
MTIVGNRISRLTKEIDDRGNPDTKTGPGSDPAPVFLGVEM